MADLNTVVAVNTIDTRGSACPGPLLEAKKGLGKVKINEVLAIYTNDPDIRIDLQAWAVRVGHEYLGYQEAQGYDKHFIARKK